MTSLIAHRNRTRLVGALSCLVALVLAVGLLPASAFADIQKSDVILGRSVEESGLPAVDCPNIAANHAYVVDSDGKVFFARDADEEVNIASVTKVMTALVALEYGDLDKTTVTISKEAAAIGESSAGLKEGDELTLEEALKAMMINSGNDAAQAIAECLGPSVRSTLEEKGEKNLPSDPCECFVLAMNKKAEELGMGNTLFANPHGLDFDDYAADMYSSAKDVHKMVAAAMENDLFRSIVSTDKETIEVDRDGSTAEVKLQSTDTLLGSFEPAIGVKTGFTELAGECFAGAFKWGDKTLYCIVLDSSSESQRFKDARALYEWVDSHQVEFPLAHTKETATCRLDGIDQEVPVVAEVSNQGWLDKTFKATIAQPEASVSVCSLEGNVSQKADFEEVTGDVHVGDKVGTLTFYQHNNELSKVDIIAAEDCPGPGLIETLQVWWAKTFGGESSVKSKLINETPLIYGGKSN